MHNFATNIFQVCTNWLDNQLSGAPQLREWLHALGKTQKGMLKRIRIDWLGAGPSVHERRGLCSKYERYFADNGVVLRKDVVRI